MLFAEGHPSVEDVIHMTSLSPHIVTFGLNRNLGSPYKFGVTTQLVTDRLGSVFCKGSSEAVQEQWVTHILKNQT